MALTTSQKLNEIKRSFHKYLEDNLEGVAIDFDDANFVPPDDASFLVVRYRRSYFESCGIGGVITGDQGSLRGRWHGIAAYLTVYKRDDPQKADAGELHDAVADLLKAGDIPLYDLTNPGSPVEAGKIYLDPIPADAGPSPIGGRLFDSYASRELIEAGFAWISLSIQLSVLEEY